VQFLVSFRGAEGVEKKPSSFRAFVLGQPRDDDRREVRRPFGLAVREGVVYVCDAAANLVARFDFRARSYRILGTGGLGKLRKPVTVAIDEAGLKFVADTLRQQVVVFGPDDAYVNAFSLPDSGKPVDVAVRGNELYVLDNDKTPQVVVLDRTSGRVLRTFGSLGAEEGQFNLPSAIAIGPTGDVFVSDTLNFRIQRLTREGKVVWARGQAGRRLGEFGRPKGIAVGPDGVIYVAEAAMELVQMFSPEGQILMHLGGPGDAPGALTLPATVAVDRTSIPDFQRYVYPGFAVDYLLFVTSQFGPPRVSVYAFGRFPEGHLPPASAIKALPVPEDAGDTFGPGTPRSDTPTPSAPGGGQDQDRGDAEAGPPEKKE
jgi:DNA-binding beta-propeller fold protein YncE